MAGARESLRIVATDADGNLTWLGIPLGVPGERSRAVTLAVINTKALANADSAVISGSGELIIGRGDRFYDVTLGTIVGTTDFILLGVETVPTGGGDVILDITPFFDGEGALSATVEGPATSIAALSGDGALSAAVQAIPTVAADLDGEGTLTATVSTAGATTAQFTGEGALTATVAPVSATPAELHSEGQLWVSATADGLMAVAARVPSRIGASV